MMKALHPSLRNKMNIFFKMQKCRNGMIKLGIHTNDRESDLQKQGEFLAASKFKEQLISLFREEATLESLSGPEYKIIRKTKHFLAQLHKIGHPMKTNDIERIKQDMYQETYGLIKEEILQLEQMSEVTQHVSITKKLSHYKKIISRITEEVPIFDNLKNQNELVSINRSTVAELT